MPGTGAPGRHWTLFAVAVGVTAVFSIDVCELVYRCGCRHLWAGAAAHCNVHGTLPPHCPWCVDWRLGAIPFLGTVTAQAGLLLGPTRLRTTTSFVLAILALPLVAGLLGLVVGVATGYWS